jgi:hypothetical protein
VVNASKQTMAFSLTYFTLQHVSNYNIVIMNKKEGIIIVPMEIEDSNLSSIFRTKSTGLMLASTYQVVHPRRDMMLRRLLEPANRGSRNCRNRKLSRMMKHLKSAKGEDWLNYISPEQQMKGARNKIGHQKPNLIVDTSSEGLVDENGQIILSLSAHSFPDTNQKRTACKGKKTLPSHKKTGWIPPKTRLRGSGRTTLINVKMAKKQNIFLGKTRVVALIPVK